MRRGAQTRCRAGRIDRVETPDRRIQRELVAETALVVSRGRAAVDLHNGRVGRYQVYCFRRAEAVAGDRHRVPVLVHEEVGLDRRGNRRHRGHKRLGHQQEADAQDHEAFPHLSRGPVRQRIHNATLPVHR